MKRATNENLSDLISLYKHIEVERYARDHEQRAKYCQQEKRKGGHIVDVVKCHCNNRLNKFVFHNPTEKRLISVIDCHVCRTIKLKDHISAGKSDKKKYTIKGN